MCLGSLVLPRVVSASGTRCGSTPCWSWVSAARGLAIWSGFAARQALLHRLGHGSSGILLRGRGRAICLLPPTMLMGATLPAIARWVETTPKGVSWLGLFYGGNIAGAVFGCLLAGFLPAARVRHAGRHVRGRGDQRRSGRTGAAAFASAADAPC